MYYSPRYRMVCNDKNDKPLSDATPSLMGDALYQSRMKAWFIPIIGKFDCSGGLYWVAFNKEYWEIFLAESRFIVIDYIYNGSFDYVVVTMPNSEYTGRIEYCTVHDVTPIHRTHIIYEKEVL